MKKVTFFIALLFILLVSVSIVTADNDTSDVLSIDDGSADEDVDEVSASDTIEKIAADNNINKVLKANSDNKKEDSKDADDKLSAADEVKIKKVWKDDNNASGKRPSSINVTLKLNGKTWGDEPIKLDAAHDWETVAKVSFGDNDKVEVVEEDVPGYTTKVTGDAESGFTITNTLKEEKNATSTDNDDRSTDDSDDDSIDDSDDTPENETQLIKTITTTKVVKKEPKKVKDKHNTGNPILLGVLAISVAGLAYQLRRKE